MKFYHEGADAGRFADNSHISDRDNTIEVKCIDASGFLSRFDCIDFLKIDIEGAERFVIPAIESQLPKVKKIFIEYHSEKDKKQCLVKLLDILKDFRIYMQPVFSPKCPLYEVTDYLGFDSQINIFGIRI